MINKTMLPPLLVALSLTTAHAYTEVGLHPSSSYTASGAAMGNAVASLPAHPSNIWINPGGLAYQKGVLFYGAPHDEATGFDEEVRDRIFMTSYAGLGGGTMGAAFLLRQQPEQSFSRDGAAVPVDINEPAFLLSYGRMAVGKLGVGISLIGYQHRADDEALDGDVAFGATAGVLYRTEYLHKGRTPIDLRCGLSVANAGPRFDLGEGEADMPLTLRSGFSARWEKERGTEITGAADLYVLYRDLGGGSDFDRWGGGVGVEARMNGVVAVRAGYRWDDDFQPDDWTYGFGVGNEVYEHLGGALEYAHSPGEGGFADHIGVRLYWIP